MKLAILLIAMALSHVRLIGGLYPEGPHLLTPLPATTEFGSQRLDFVTASARMAPSTFDYHHTPSYLVESRSPNLSDGRNR